jgi:lysophospholipase L1-like esterase
MNIIVVGASIAQGFWDTEGGWVARITKKFMKQAIDTRDYDVPRIFNLGVSGDNAKRILKRLGTELSARVDGREDIVLFSFATNDSCRRDGKYATSPEEFAEDLAQIHKIASEHVDNVAFCNILPCDEKLTQPVAWNDSVYYYNDRIDQFNAVIKECCGGGAS